jgi:hypothetical protein
MPNSAPAFSYAHTVETDVPASRIWPVGERQRVTYAARIDGPAARAREIGPLITADFPQTMASLIALAASSAPRPA